MHIRKDFEPVSHLLSRLLEYAKVFCALNVEDWSHLKNKEDFSHIERFPFEDRAPLEQIYCDGRDLAIFMSSKLAEFNSAEYYPTLKSYVDSFENGWVYQIDILSNVSQQAKDKAKSLEHCPWAIGQMIDLFDRQINILLSIRHTLDALKQTDLYKWESGKGQATFPDIDYKRILDCINSVGRMFERLPSTYSNKDEESLRDHILVSLQSIMFGSASATGETFNKRGKTDILVRSSGRNEFIGECKFWTGKEGFFSTISQLLGYLSWRDNKAAVIFFVQNRDFSAVIEKVRSYLPEHPDFLRQISIEDGTWINCEFRMREDQSRVVQLAVMLFHLP